MNLKKLTAFWNDIRDSLWFLPGVLTLASALLALITIQLDVIGVLPEVPGGIWFFSGTAAGARGVLTAIASGFITVTGVVFSVTIVALQLASSQFTPRILRSFTADRANQLVLGVFIATFTYALLVLRVVRGEDDAIAPDGLESAADAFVPHLSVTVGLALAMVGIGFLIFFIDHVAESIQASVILRRVTGDALETVDRLVPEDVGVPAEEGAADAATPRAQGSVIHADRSGYVQGLDSDKLLDLVTGSALTIRIEVGVGRFVLPGVALATVWPAGSHEESGVGSKIRDTFIVGHTRTPHMDVELGLIELTDMAVKALSPGINDPTTATLCVDRLCEVLLAFARREQPARVRRSSEGEGTLVLPRIEFPLLVRTAFVQVRHYGVGNPHFAITLLERLGELGALLPAEHRRPVLDEATSLLRTAREIMRDESDLRRLEEAARRALPRLDATRAP